MQSDSVIMFNRTLNTYKRLGFYEFFKFSDMDSQARVLINANSLSAVLFNY